MRMIKAQRGNSVENLDFTAHLPLFFPLVVDYRLSRQGFSSQGIGIPACTLPFGNSPSAAISPWSVVDEANIKNGELGGNSGN